MPIKRGKDNEGCYYQWGGQTKYYFKCDSDIAAENAKKKAIAQAVAAGGTKSEFSDNTIIYLKFNNKDNNKQ